MFVSTARGRRLCAGLLLSAYLAAAAIGCGSAADETPRHRPSAEAKAGSIVSRADRLQWAHFALLRGYPEGLPQSITVVLPRGGGVGANWGLAQRLPTLTTAAWAVPGRGYLCLVESPPEGSVALSCTSTGYVLKQGTYSASVPPHNQLRPRRRVIVGLAPDGVRQVVVHTADSPPQDSQVIQNTFVLEDESVLPPESVELVIPD